MALARCINRVDYLVTQIQALPTSHDRVNEDFVAVQNIRTILGDVEALATAYGDHILPDIGLFGGCLNDYESLIRAPTSGIRNLSRLFSGEDARRQGRKERLIAEAHPWVVFILVFALYVGNFGTGAPGAC